MAVKKSERIDMAMIGLSLGGVICWIVIRRS